MKRTSKTSLVFVYGTLLAGERNDRFTRDARLVRADAALAGKYLLLDLGPYPALVDSRRAGRVVGEVYAVNEEQLRRLDVLEGVAGRFPLYERRAVKLTTGEQVFVYVMPAERVARMDPAPVIVNGSWRLRAAEERPCA